VERTAHASLPAHPDHVRECRDCGLLQLIPELMTGNAVAHCARCEAVLRRSSAHTELFPLICAGLAALLFLGALTLPFMDVRAPGHETHASLFTGPDWLRDRGFWPLAIVVFVTLIAMPFLKLAGLVTTLVAMHFPKKPRWLGRVYRWTRAVSPWAMTEVFLLGSFVAYTRLAAMATVHVDAALYALFGVLLATVASQATLDEESIWDAAGALRDEEEIAKRADSHISCEGCGRLERGQNGDPCLRCGDTLHFRRPRSLERTWALLVSGAMLYLPANILPVMTTTKLGRPETNTIISGVIELADLHLMLLAVLVFTASLFVPLMKLVGLSTMLVTTHLGTDRWLRGRTRLFRVIDAIGRWSMIDVFIVAILVGLVHMGFIGTVIPEWGAVAFCGVVVITMFAAAGFDPRLMWDAAEARKREVSS
jgi:paraquat-inducible protein A